MKFGRLAYQMYYRPRRWLLEANEHGLQNYLLFNLNLYRLPRRLKTLWTVSLPASQLRFAFLTGNKFWYQTAYCALSLCLRLNSLPVFVIFDDGTLLPHQIETLKHLFPSLVYHDNASCEAVLEKHLPREDYPHLRAARDSNVLMRKLLDVNLLESGCTYLDSDMIFWRTPKEMIDYIQRGMPFYMLERAIPVDYGLFASRLDIERQTAIAPIEHFNSGVFNLGKERLDWQLLEELCCSGQQIQTITNPALIEQTLFAQIFSQFKERKGLGLSYRVLWKSITPSSTLSHYVYKTKVEYLGVECEKLWSEILNFYKQ